MSRLVVISNRLADPRKPAAGGLAVALGEALNQTGGLWFGWSGTVVEGGTPGEGELHTRQAGPVTLATVDLCREDHDSYYHGYSNSVLWPVFHYRLDLADFNASYIAGYRRVNQMFARKLLPLLRDDDVIWVHDYHLIPLAAELRAMGCKQRIGFFLHIPMPPPLIMAAIPQHEWLMRSLFAYDLVGLQSEADVAHFTRYVRNEGSAEAVDEKRVRAFGATVVVQSFPIGIDVDEFTRLTHAPDAVETYENMRDEYSRRRLLLGIDRLDYSKGIPHRVRAFRELLDRYPENRGSATMIMIASPSRDDVHAYADLRQELEGLCGSINGDYGELDWMPVEPGGQGIRGGARPGQPRRAGAVTLCGCGGAAERSAAGEPLRPPGHGRQHPAGAADAAGRAAGAPPEAHGAHPGTRRALVAQGIHGCAAGLCGLKPSTPVTEGAQTSPAILLTPTWQSG